MRHTPLLLAGMLALLPTSASAENFEQFGFGARAQGMGGAFTALASDASAAYYNPGGLILSRHLNLSLGFSYADYQLDFDSQRGGKLDDDATRIAPLSAFTFGVSTTVPLDVPDRFAFALAFFVPTRGIIDLDARATSSLPEWFSYGSRHDRMILIPAVAVKVTDWLGFGVGGSIGLDAVGGTRIVAPLSAEPVQTDFEVSLRPSVGAVLGLMVSPADWISFGLTYRSETKMKVKFPAEAIVQGFRLPLQLDAVQFFSPHQVQAGLAVNVTNDIMLSFDVAWVDWSSYDNPFLDVFSDTLTVIQAPSVNFRDVISPKLGLEVVVNDWLIVRGGYWYSQTPVPSQDFAPTNIAGSDKHVFTFGCGIAFGKPPQAVSDEAKQSEGRAQTMDEALVDASFDLDLFVQYHLHTRASATKATTDPAGNWDADGGILNLGFTLTARF